MSEKRAPSRVGARVRDRREKELTFDKKTWENRGQGKFLRGFRICVRQYNQGSKANFYLEAWGDSLHGKPAPSVGKTIPGKGPAARDAAISEALKLASSGIYAI